MSDAARRLAHEWAAAPRGPRRPPGGVCDCDCASVVWSRSEIQTRVGVRLALLAVGGRIVTGCSARPAVACLAPCGKTFFRRGAPRAGPPAPSTRAVCDNTTDATADATALLLPAQNTHTTCVVCAAVVARSVRVSVRSADVLCTIESFRHSSTVPCTWACPSRRGAAACRRRPGPGRDPGRRARGPGVGSASGAACRPYSHNNQH